MPRYEDPAPDAVELIRKLKARDYPELQEADVNVGCEFAFPSKAGAKGLCHHGWPVGALVSIVSHKNRVAGLPDAIIYVAGDRWEELTYLEQESLIWHELHHLVVVRDKEGEVKTDDCNRPKLSMKPHDAELGIFYAGIAKYGHDSLDSQVCWDLISNLHQRDLFELVEKDEGRREAV